MKLSNIQFFFVNSKVKYHSFFFNNCYFGSVSLSLIKNNFSVIKKIKQENAPSLEEFKEINKKKELPIIPTVDKQDKTVEDLDQEQKEIVYGLNFNKASMFQPITAKEFAEWERRVKKNHGDFLLRQHDKELRHQGDTSFNSFIHIMVMLILFTFGGAWLISYFQLFGMDCAFHNKILTYIYWINRETKNK